MILITYNDFNIFFVVTGVNVQKSFKKMHNEFKLENVNFEIT